MKIITIKGFTVLLLALGLGACASTEPTRFYALSAETPAASPSTTPRTIVGVGPIEVAPYLERGQIVTRDSRNRLSLAEFDQWAEPIETNISNVIAANLDTQLPTIQAIVRPWPDADAEYTVVVKFSRFDADKEGNVLLAADWGIQNRREQSIPVIRDSRIRLTGQGSDYTAIAASMSTALATLSQEIATELDRLLP